MFDKLGTHSDKFVLSGNQQEKFGGCRLRSLSLTLLVSLFTIINIFLRANHGYAALTVQLVVFPDIRTIMVGTDQQKIALIARVNSEGMQFTWEIDGQGKAEIKTTEREIAYFPPATIETDSAEITIRVTATDSRGETATDRVTFLLTKGDLIPTPTPTPIRIGQLILKTAHDTILDPTYTLEAGQSVTIAFENLPLPNRRVKLEGKAVKGGIGYDQHTIIYTAPNTPGRRDIVTIKVFDRETGQVVVQQIIKIQIQ